MISKRLDWELKNDKEIESLQRDQKEGQNPRDIKFILAEEIVDRFHGQNSGIKAREEFKKRFQRGEIPTDVEEIEIKLKPKDITLPRVLKDSGMVTSTSEAMRLIKQGAIKIEGKKIIDLDYKINPNSSFLCQIGKKRFLRIRIPKK